MILHYKKFMTPNISAALGLQQRKYSASGAIHVDLSPAQKAPAHHWPYIWWADSRRCREPTAAIGPLVVRFMLTYPLPKMPARTTSRIFGGPIHAAVGNRQQRSDHYGRRTNWTGQKWLQPPCGSVMAAPEASRTTTPSPAKKRPSRVTGAPALMLAACTASASSGAAANNNS